MSVQSQLSQITSPQINHVISQGFAEIYLNKPNFPITYLANYLKQYSQSQKRKKQLINRKKEKQQRYQQIIKTKQEHEQNIIKQNQQKSKKTAQKDQSYEKRINETKHLEDLLVQSLPQFIQKVFNFTGAYVGKLDFNKKNVEEGNFQLGAENDTENPKVISYIGASKSHQPLTIAKYLPNGKGISYDVFEQAPEQSNQQGQLVNIPQKKTYLYINNVLKEPKLHYFKYPKLGAYVCYPIKIKSCLNIPTLDKGIIDYKAYLKTKQQTQKQYQDKLNQAHVESQDANKKFEDFELNQQDPASHQLKKNYEAEAQAARQKYQQLFNNPPIVEEIKFETVQKNFFLGCDTLGQDKQIEQQTLQNINTKISYFVSEWQQKQRKMILTDILTFLQEQTQLQNIQNVLNQHQKNILSNYQAQIKQQFANKQKESEYQLSLIKCQKTRQLLNQPNFKNSMEVYLNYNVPKFTELIQIWCMLLRFSKHEINSPQSNQLNHRKIINKDSFKGLIEKMEKYQLRRQSSQTVTSQYKINKLLQRLQKIDVQALSKYNGFLFVLHYLLKTYCWTRILCRDAKKQIFETKTKLKQDRQNQIQKWLGQVQKNLQTAKAELDEQGQQNFKEEDWRKNYETENPKPQALDPPVYQEFLDIQ